MRVSSAGATSVFGTQDQGGNLAEWLAEPAQDAMRVTRGGGYNSPYLGGQVTGGGGGGNPYGGYGGNPYVGPAAAYYGSR